ncbi:MAG: M56 family metallopeptidase [Pseudomonadota bacterium]
MNALLSAFVPHLAWALLDFVWQGLLIGWFAALGFALLRKARPQTRYAFGCAALLLCLALPLAGTVQRVLDARSATSSLLPPGGAASPRMIELGQATPLLPVADRLATVEQSLQARLPLVILFWSCGAGFLALRMVLGLAWVRRRSQPAYSRPDPVWQARLDRIAAQLGVTRTIVLGLVDDLSSPVTAGWLRPVVLLPTSLASGMPLELLEALLAHEVAHIKRYDYLVNLIQSAIEIVLFYHPTVWWLSNRIRVEREQIADDLAASMLGEPRRLALALSELDQFQFSPPQLAHGAHGGNLMSRIKRLVRPDTEPLNWKMAMPILGLAAACAAFYANAQTAPAPQRAPAPAPQRAPSPAPTAAPAPAPAPAPVIRARVAPAPAPVPKVARINVSNDKRRGDTAYALVRGDRNRTMMSGSSDDWREVDQAKRSVSGDFLWYRKDGKAYFIQDPAVMARVDQAHARLNELGAEMEVHGKVMEGHGKVMEKLGAEMERAARNGEFGGNMKAEERKLAALSRMQDKLGREMDQLGRRMDKANRSEQRELERDMAKVSEKMEELSRQMEKEGESMSRAGEQMARAHAPMEAIGKQMEEAGKPMESLGKKMEALGKIMEVEGDVADKAVRAAIEEAHAKGLGQPLAR